MKKIFQITALLFACTFSSNLVQAQSASAPGAAANTTSAATGAAVQGVVIGIGGVEKSPASGILIGTSTGVVAGGYSSANVQPAIGARDTQAATAPEPELSK